MKRFYDSVALTEARGGWQVALDGRGVNTVGGAAQIVPTPGAAQALAGEWEAQGREIDPATFPLRHVADYAIDVVAHDPAAHADGLLRYGETDTLLYRADPDEPLHARQQATWEPIVARFEEREGARCVRVSGIVHRPQPPATMEHLRGRLRALDPFALAAVETTASLAASLIVAIEALDACEAPDASCPQDRFESLWDAVSLEEEWQAELWGREAEAETRRAARRAQFLQACQWLHLVRGWSPNPEA